MSLRLCGSTASGASLDEDDAFATCAAGLDTTGLVALPSSPGGRGAVAAGGGVAHSDAHSYVATHLRAVGLREEQMPRLLPVLVFSCL